MPSIKKKTTTTMQKEKNMENLNYEVAHKYTDRQILALPYFGLLLLLSGVFCCP